MTKTDYPSKTRRTSDFGRTNSPGEAAPGPTESTSEAAIKSGEAELRERAEAGSNSTGLHIVTGVPLDIGSLIRDVESILKGADEDQAALTWRYIKAGRRLWEIYRVHREGKRRAAVMKRASRNKRRVPSIKPAPRKTFDQLLARSFPHRRRSTLREYMTLAKEFDAADEATKVQLTGLFQHGWGPVLNEIRRRKRRKRGQQRNGQPAKGDCDFPDLRILLGDCMIRLRELADESVDCVVTSVPYFRCLVFPGATTVFGGDWHCVHAWEKRQFVRRHYNNSYNTVESGTCRKCGAELVMLGWEDTVAEYVRHLVKVFDEVKRVLKPTGVFWFNIADTFLDKELLLVPHRLATALADDGWTTCRQEVIWHVTNRAPENATDRFYRNHEQVFMFVKQKDHYFDAAGARERAISAVKPGKEVRFGRQVVFQGTAGTWPSPGRLADGMRNRRTVWSIPNELFSGDHPCPFPKALVEPMVLSSCPEGGVCLDPFGGTGTTGLVALAHGRKAVLIEASAEHCGIAKHRIDTELGPYKAELEKRREQEDAKLSVAAA
jgi:DNA modification methylase